MQAFDRKTPLKLIAYGNRSIQTADTRDKLISRREVEALTCAGVPSPIEVACDPRTRLID